VLVAALRGGSYARSRIAAQLETFPLRVPHLIGPLLADHDPAVRYWGTKLAAVHTGAASPEELAELAAELDAQIRAAAAEALGTSAADRDTLVRLLHDAVPFVRAHAARALGATGAAGAAGEIAPLLGDPDWWVRAAAKEGLQRVGPAAATVLVPLLDDSDRFVRNGAAEVLQRVGTLDELLTSFGDEDGADAQLLRKLFQAGEHRYALLALERAPEERRQLLRELVPAT
jgi:HEAT repeat protein